MQHLQAVGGGAGDQSAPLAAVQPPAPAKPATQPARPRVLLSFAQLTAKLNVSERTARKIVAESWMCEPVVLGPRALRWVESEVDEALANRAPRRPEPLPEPENLTRGREARRSRLAAA